MQEEYHIRTREDYNHPMIPNMPAKLVSEINQFLLDNNLKAFYANSKVSVIENGGLPWLCKDGIWFEKEQDRNYFILFYSKYFVNGSKEEALREKLQRDSHSRYGF